MCAPELVQDRTSRQPAPALTSELVSTSKGLILLPCGTHSNVIRFLVALIATSKIVNEGLDSVKTCLVEAANEAA